MKSIKKEEMYVFICGAVRGTELKSLKNFLLWENVAALSSDSEGNVYLFLSCLIKTADVVISLQRLVITRRQKVKAEIWSQ